MGGTIIHELSHLSALRRLSFVGNTQLHGTLPESWGGLSQLRTLDLDELQLNGTIPESYANLQKLEYLSISASGIMGQVPHGIYLLPKLEHLSLSYNGLTGTIPEYGSNTPFVNLWLENNDFTGTIPSSIFNSTLKTLILWGNHLTGTLSSNIRRFEDLFYLDLEINSLSGTIPTEIGQVHKLEKVYLSHNSISGSIPSELGQLDRLDALWLNNNKLSGVVPLELSQLSSVYMTLNFNELSGDLYGFCDRLDSLSPIAADCADGPGDDDAALDCPCCFKCCHGEPDFCATNFTVGCQLQAANYQEEGGVSYSSVADTTCDCIGSGVNTTLSCRDNCETCNLDRTVCSTNDNFIIQVNENSVNSYYKTTFQYVVGRNDTVTYEKWVNPDYSSRCEVRVNGEPCNSCSKHRCADGFGTVRVSCDNVEGAGNVNVCDEVSYDDGPLLLFALQDPLVRDGCPPRFFE